MSYLGVDVLAARELGLQLRQSASLVDVVQSSVGAAETLAELDVGCTQLLEQLEQNLRVAASATEQAANQIANFVLPMSWARDRVDLVAPARWDATVLAPWNQVHQDASHNSYKVDGGIEALFVNGVRTFELDIHRGAPTDFTASVPEIVIDHIQHDGGQPGEWQVYHLSGDAATEYESFSDGLAALVSLPTTDPLTVFVDNKDSFGAQHSAAQLDELVVRSLGPRLFGSHELLARAPGAATLQQAVRVAGWPTVSELAGRVIVVLTDDVSRYPRETGRLFVAQSPRFDHGQGGPVHLQDPNVVIYNVDSDRMSDAEIVAVQATTSLLRTYGNRRCAGRTRHAAAGGVNYRAIDIDGDDPACLPASAPGVDRGGE